MKTLGYSQFEVLLFYSHPACLPAGFSSIEHGKMTPSQQRLMDVYGTEYKKSLPTACIREELFTQQGKFLSDYSRGEDTEWIARICAGGVDAGHCLTERLYLTRIHGGQVSYQEDALPKERLAMYADAIRNAKRGNQPC